MVEDELKQVEAPEYIGRYHLCSMIAKGGMAKIYQATDNLIGRDVAIKITDTSDPSWAKIKPETVMHQFEREVQISGQLSHPNFVTVYDAGQEGHLSYLVMELLEGVTLDRLIKTGQPELELREKLDILIQIARALHQAHQRGIIHRDIKPSNIMRLPNGQAKLMDFGVAVASEATSIKIKEYDSQVSGGTPYYMSPEQINKAKVDGRSDLFSLSIVAYELLTGSKPFVANTPFNLYEKILRSTPQPMKELNPSIPDKVAAIISICLNKDPHLRLQSIQAFADQLDEIVNESFFENEGKAITEETLRLLQKYRESFTFFFDLDNSQIYTLLQVCQIRKYKKGDVIFNEGEVAREMYLIISGDIRISRATSDAGSIIISMMKRGDVLGEMGIIDGGPRSASATAETNCQTLVLHQVSLLRCDDNTAGKIYRNLSHILSSKLRITASRLEDLSRRSNI
ncbi:hypothetical protein MNBD_NITROSPINAE01-306 [hydrothermal vent metagenome]|uniref:Serine/threonine protein kinase n=1 Tax=hydrothermal vent metagenome TaxID=652676 RepID=A0A3B1CFH2_9ZZZZ